MKKTTDLLHARRLIKAFVSTVWQYLLFKIIFVTYTQIDTISHAYMTTAWHAFILYIAIPLIGGCICCRIVNRRSFKFQMENVKGKLSIQRLSVRLLAAICFVAMGFILEKIRVADPELPVRLLAKAGANNGFVFELIFDFSLSVLTAILPVSYAVVEWLFKPVAQE